MKNSNRERFEELVAGFISDTLNDDEIEELNLLSKDYEDFDFLKNNYLTLVNDIKKIPSPKASKSLEKRIIESSNIILTKKSIYSFSNLIKLLFLSVSGILLINLNETTLKYASINNNENSQEKALINSEQSNVFILSSKLKDNNYINASVSIRPNKATNVLKVQGLPQLSSGLTYRLWAYTNLGPQGCVSFLPDKNGNVIMNVPSEPTTSAKRVIISIDKFIPGSGPEIPGEVVLTSI